MRLKIFTIRDSKGETYNTPFFQKTHGEAERNFRELVKDEKSMVAKYPDDFDLYYLGEYDDTNGNIISLETPQHMVKAVNCKATI
uniref:Nonstructural protein n=1 Tax=Gokushovirinae environmental samples TaxID=1478972 RepID=A0A2R3UAB5_9VIRU|nr:nonstructural protein [Gokushovirinae environmental samples]